jgi:large subunit ribosomal protein L4
MKLTVKDMQGKDQGELEIKLALIENGRGTEAVHQTVVAYNAAQRMGTACTKNVGEVAGTNKKPWRQKGTGRARAGSFQSPLWRGGGVVFGPKPRDFSLKVNRGARQLALRKALSERLMAGDVMIVEDLKLPGLAQHRPGRVGDRRIAQHLPGVTQRKIGLYTRRLRTSRKAAGQGIT